jgi:hypothetical protein
MSGLNSRLSFYRALQAKDADSKPWHAVSPIPWRNAQHADNKSSSSQGGAPAEQALDQEQEHQGVQVGARLLLVAVAVAKCRVRSGELSLGSGRR